VILESQLAEPSLRRFFPHWLEWLRRADVAAKKVFLCFVLMRVRLDFFILMRWSVVCGLWIVDNWKEVMSTTSSSLKIAGGQCAQKIEPVQPIQKANSIWKRF